MMSFKEIVQTLGTLGLPQSAERLGEMMGRFRDSREFLPEAFDIIIKTKQKKENRV